MQAGFALLTTGLTRAKNAGHMMMLNFAAFVIALIAYFAVGFAFQFGGAAINAAPGNLGGAMVLGPPDQGPRQPLGAHRRCTASSCSPVIATT